MKALIDRQEELEYDWSRWPDKTKKLIESGDAKARSVLSSYKEFIQRGEFDYLEIFVDPAKISIDVGTNNGQYALKLASISKGCLCLEPVRALDYVKDLLPPNCVHMSVAAGRCAGIATLRIPKYNQYMDYAQSTLSPDNSLGGNKYEEQVVDVLTIDELATQAFPGEAVGFMKIDVEGFEDAVLEGASETIKKHKPNLKIELHGNQKIKSVCDFLHRLEYRGVFFFNGRIYDSGTFDASVHRATENEFNWRKSKGLEFDPSKYVCDFFFIPSST